MKSVHEEKLTMHFETLSIKEKISYNALTSLYDKDYQFQALSRSCPMLEVDSVELTAPTALSQSFVRKEWYTPA